MHIAKRVLYLEREARYTTRMPEQMWCITFVGFFLKRAQRFGLFVAYIHIYTYIYLYILCQKSALLGAGGEVHNEDARAHGATHEVDRRRRVPAIWRRNQTSKEMNTHEKKRLKKMCSFRMPELLVLPTKLTIGAEFLRCDMGKTCKTHCAQEGVLQIRLERGVD